MSDISRNEICLDVELEGAIPMSVPPADAYILYVERAENAAASAESSATAAAASASAAKISETNAANSAKGAESSKTAAAASASAAKTSETNAANSATSAESSANKAKDIADSIEGLAGITGIATTDEAIAGVVDNKAMTPLKTKEAIESLVPMQRLIDLIYPVGSIYMSVNSTSPADLFGGTWEAKCRQDVFCWHRGHQNGE